MPPSSASVASYPLLMMDGSLKRERKKIITSVNYVLRKDDLGKQVLAYTLRKRGVFYDILTGVASSNLLKYLLLNRINT